MTSKLILDKLTKNRNDLELIRTNPTDLPEGILRSIVNSVEERAPYKAGELFKIFNALHWTNKFPENNINLDEVIKIFQERGDEIDNSIEMAKADKDLMFLPHPNLDAIKVVDILISQMLSNAEEATFELQIDALIKNKFG